MYLSDDISGPQPSGQKIQNTYPSVNQTSNSHVPPIHQRLFDRLRLGLLYIRFVIHSPLPLLLIRKNRGRWTTLTHHLPQSCHQPHDVLVHHLPISAIRKQTVPSPTDCSSSSCSTRLPLAWAKRLLFQCQSQALREHRTHSDGQRIPDPSPPTLTGPHT